MSSISHKKSTPTTTNNTLPKRKAHIQELVKQCSRDINRIRNLSGASWEWAVRTNKTLMTQYRSLIHANLDYGFQAYGITSAEKLRKPYSIQLKSTSNAQGVHKSTSKKEVREITGEPPCTSRRNEMMLGASLECQHIGPTTSPYKF
ncbi:hypothetical protein CHS0354_027548 [Potamilus streckersoni]|uniref:Uncharacterized protein n=1 Tax=Potamilus streckersoni TaxID=2493646 RepID=A0AAE0S121_9BIVA|nr:hypothetical protein CHS0354_027548 [Potamilus streckersoni]